MKILALDLSLGSEDISLNPNRYGGVGRTLAYLRENIDGFFVAGHQNSFKNCGTKEKLDKNIVLSDYQIYQLRDGEFLETVIENKYDLIFHTNPKIFIPSKSPCLVWSVGFNEEFHPGNKNALFHNYQGQKPIFYDFVSIHQFILGIDLPKFQNYQKEDFIFQCSNHYPQIQTTRVAYFGHRFNVKVILAGPIADKYDLLQFVDNKTVVYLGEIPEHEKIEYLKKAGAVSALYAHEINETPLAIKQALGYGCPIFTTALGHLPELIKENVNGFFINNENDFEKAWSLKKNIEQKNCYESVKIYSIPQMVKSMNSIFEQVISKAKSL